MTHVSVLCKTLWLCNRLLAVFVSLKKKKKNISCIVELLWLGLIYLWNYASFIPSFPHELAFSTVSKSCSKYFFHVINIKYFSQSISWRLSKTYSAISFYREQRAVKTVHMSVYDFCFSLYSFLHQSLLLTAALLSPWFICNFFQTKHIIKTVVRTC